MDRRSGRLAGLRDALARADLDGLLITSLPNVRYLTGFSGSNALLFVSAKDCVLLTDFRYATQVEEEVGAAAVVRIEPANLWTGLWTTLSAMVGVERIGFESSHLIHRDFQRLLEHGARLQWRPTTELVETLRVAKDDGELACIRHAVDIAERALRATLPLIAPGQTETQVAGLLERELRQAGSEAFPFARSQDVSPQSGAL